MISRSTLPFLLTLLLSAAACGGGGGTDEPGAKTMKVSGLVSLQGASGGTPSALGGAEVRATIDRNGNGAIGAGESWSATTGADGTFVLRVPVTGTETVVLRFSDAGSDTASVFRTLRATSSADVVANATLRSLVTLDCEGTSCSIGTGAITLAGLPADASGKVRVFNPATEAEAFPGNFDDADGNLLVSGVFATFAMKDAGGDDLTTLASDVEMRVRMPRDTWGAIVDITLTTTDVIEVPLYYFDEVAGTWVRGGTGWLADSERTPVPASELPNLRNGSYAGDVYVVGNIGHFSTWNVDWPIASHGCVTGRIVDGSAKVVEGATVSVRGVSYTGTSTPVTVGADGTFCVEAMRSEDVGEDVDGDGTTGETTRVAIRAVAGGKVYSLGERDMATAAGVCGAGCLDLGDLVLDAASLLSAGLCTVDGVVEDRTGAPVSGASVYAWDEGIPEDIWEALCISDLGFVCTIAATSGVDGSFSVTAPVMESVTTWGMATVTAAPVTDTLMGVRTVSGCPAAPVTLTLDQGFRAVEATLGVTAGEISWTPGGYDAAYILVSTSAGDPKWYVVAEGAGFAGPVTYGTIPVGAKQVFPDDGVTAPAALAPLDVVNLFLSGTTASGLPYMGSATFTVTTP